jgi:hypothetical protein
MYFQTKLVLLIVCQVLFIGTTSSIRTRYSRSINNERLPLTFGTAKMFQPLPSTIVGAHCQWEVKFNTVFNRIPQTITEIMCQQPSEVCGGNHAYQCRQIRSKMLVGYTEGGSVVSLRNNTVNIGCSCVRRSSNTVQHFLQPIQQKRSARISFNRRSSRSADTNEIPDDSMIDEDGFDGDLSKILM